MEQQEPKDSLALIRALCILGGLIAGVLGLILAINAASSNRFLDAGVCIAASALAFGLQAHAALRR